VFAGSKCIVFATAGREVDGDGAAGDVVAVAAVGSDEGEGDVADGVGALANPSVGIATAPACRCGCDELQAVAASVATTTSAAADRVEPTGRRYGRRAGCFHSAGLSTDSAPMTDTASRVPRLIGMTSRTDELLRILQEHFNPREEGWLWIALSMNGAEGGVVNQVEGPYDDAAGAARALAMIVNETGADRAYVALCRQEGRPTERDREMWRRLRAAANADVLVDMVVFNDTDAWSMREEDAAAA
jgi:hypothetical protein